MRSLLIFTAVVFAACGDNNSGMSDAPRSDGPPPTADAPSADASTDATPSPDSNPATSMQIQTAIDTPDGTGLDLPITAATVTYLKPQIGSVSSDPAGFTIQADQVGPALFVAVDPATLTPSADVGDVVSFTITEMGTSASQRRAIAITGFTEDGTGADVDALAQDISAATDVVTALDSYDSEIVDVTGTVASAFTGAGMSFQAADIDTAGIAGNPDYELRVPTSVIDAIDLVAGCAFTLNNTPVHRFDARVQLAPYVASDITLSGCPAPTVTSAVALSSTTVRVTFSRNILASSVMPDGSQFTFDNGLTASAAAVSGTTVDVTTSAQTGGATYTVTVANTVTDLQGTPVGAPDSATFSGFQTAAVVRINEVNASIASGCDLVELRVIAGGAMDAIQLWERTASVLTFGSFTVATNDIIVVHFNSGSATCNPAGNTQETASIIEQTGTGNYATAWDWWIADSGLVGTDNVLTIVSPTSAIADAVFLTDDPIGTAAADTETQAATVAAASQWQIVGGGIPPGGFVDDDFNAHAALDLNGTGADALGDTIQRLDNTDDNDKDDWNSAVITVQVQTWGLINLGQTPF